MTKPANNIEKFTPFSLWLRAKPEFDSKQFGYVCTDLDFIWRNYKTKRWMLLEEKQYMKDIEYAQKESLVMLHELIKKGGAQGYRGLHLVQFENTTPDDGKIVLDRKEVTKEEFLFFLTMQDKPVEPPPTPQKTRLKTKEEYEEAVRKEKFYSDACDKHKAWNSDVPQHKNLVAQQQHFAGLMLEYEIENDLLPDNL